MPDSANANKPLRFMLWGMPRSLTMVLTKCLSYIEGIYVIHDAFTSASSIGPEREKIPDIMQCFMDNAATLSDSKIEVQSWDDSICTFQWAKDTMEADYPGKKIIFCKDLPSAITGHLDMLPRGFRHTFIIRNPTKRFLSFRTLLINSVLPPGVPIEQFQMDVLMKRQQRQNLYILLVDLVKYLKEEGKECSPVIIDADDLQNHPASILRQYCEAVGIPYDDSLLQWEAGDDIIKKNWYVSRTVMQGDRIGNYFGAALASTKFNPASESPPAAEIPQDVVRLSEEAMPYYKQLYDMRLKP